MFDGSYGIKSAQLRASRSRFGQRAEGNILL
jgi:hypothetical protein